MTIKELVTKAFGNAVKKGWYERFENGAIIPKKPLEAHMLIVSEVAEATEQVRDGMPEYYWKTDNGIIKQTDVGGAFSTRDNGVLQKPEGELSEMADIVIRVADYCGSHGWDLEQAIEAKMKFNATRPERHGGKKY